MSRRLALDEEDDEEPVRDRIPRTPVPQEMLLELVSLLQFGGRWYARKKGSHDYADGTTPLEAIKKALL